MFKWHRTSRVILSIALALMTLGADALFTQGRQPARNRRTVMLDGREVVEGEVIVRYRARTGRIERQRAEFQADSDTTEAIGRLGARRMRSRRLTTGQLLATLRANPDVEYVEPNYIIRASAVPNDTSMGQLWGLINTGQAVDGRSGVAGADIGAAAAWDFTTGTRANVVAILDSGIDFNHPDLAANVFTAPRQFSVTLGSTTVTCAAGTHGFNALTNTCIPADDNGHGTHVAGIIGAVGNNNTGVTGVNWIANLMAIKILDADGNGTTSDAIKGIDFVIRAKAALGADANVRVLNASWGGPNFSQAFNDEIEAANTADMLFVASAGSETSNNDEVPHYPASSTSPNVLSVAAVDNRGVLAAFSNYGPASVHLAAPGASTFSTILGNDYAYLSGTSMAAPHVAGAAALVLSACPSNTATLKSRLISSVDLESSLSGKTISGGSLNVGTAILRCVTTLSASISGSTITATVENGPGRTNDWLGLFCPTSSADGSYSDWKYLNNSQTAPATGLTAATVTFQAPSQTGVACNVRMFSNGAKIATSQTVTTGTSSSPSLTIGDISVNEGNSGTSVATFTVTVSPVNASQTVSVNYATAHGTAAAGDYVAATGSLNFPPSTATRTFTVTIQGDTTQESDETFVVNLSGAINATIADAQATGTIVNDDVSSGPTVTVTTPIVSPGGVIRFNVTNGPANRTDWVGLVDAAKADNAKLTWMYLNGSTTPPSSGLANASLQFTAPSTPGTYDIRLFSNDTYNRIARSAPISVGSGPALTIGDVSVNEGNSGTAVATFTVTLSPVNAAQTVTVNYATADGTATTGSGDYAAASGTLSFPPSTGTRTFTVSIQGDTTQENNETFVVNLSAATNATIGDAQAIGTIVTDDVPSGPAVTVTTPSVAPGGIIRFNVTNGPANRTDWVGLVDAAKADNEKLTWMYLNGATTPPSSGLANASLQFTAPTTPGTYDIRLFANDTYTRIARSGPVSVGSAPASPTLTIGDVSVNEGNSGTAVATFTVTLSPVHSSQTVTVNYATADGTATTGNGDYVAASGTLSFPPSTATRTFTVSINGDTTQESNETFVVNLSAPTNATIGDAQAIGTIVTDDVASGPAVTVTTPSVSPGGIIRFNVTNGPANRTDWVGLVDAAKADNAKLMWMYLNGSTTPPSSGLANASLQFTAPSTPGTYDIRLFANDTYTRIARSGPVTVGTVPASGPTLAIGDVSVNEGNSGTSVATFTVTLSPVNSSQTVTVNYATADGTATAGSGDYVAASGTLSFPASTATQTFTVTIQGDTTQESAETFAVNLSAATNAAIGDALAIGTIVNDDVPAGPTVTVTTPSVAPGGIIRFTVTNGPANRTDWVGLVDAAKADNEKLMWMYLNGSTMPPSSGLANASLQFTAPSTPGTYDIRLFANDTYTRIARSGPVSVASGPTLTIGDVSVSEGNSGTTVATFTVTLSPVNTSQTVTVNYATANGTAMAGVDYVAASGTLSFPASTSTQTFTVPIQGDTTQENDETLVINLSAATNAMIGDAQATGTIVNDDFPPGPMVNVASTTVQPGAIIQFTVSAGPGNRTDWVSLSPVSAADNGYLVWMYLSGSKTAPATGQTSASLQFTAPTTPGSYNIRFFANDGFTKLATSATITVP